MTPDRWSNLRARLQRLADNEASPCGKPVRRVLAFADETDDGEEVRYTAGACALMAGHDGDCDERRVRPLFDAETVRDILAERDRLALMLACERGEPGSAPEEWWVPGPGGWAKPGPRGFDMAMVCREDMTDDAEWYVYDEHGDSVTSGTCATMLEAIEAADAAMEADRAR